ncbi:MAG: bifunctional adenosylcobinamide kinase/adenosylcobinamide-phosphate guanylyltransferase [Marinifilaceae bacterium]|jgi:adenosylcobinamide kinase/adenosylcobinamide-phosphate guanylyltransferase|nr:bifunctional adenosylcobinamide kinase/adenosylcobinamide-phosphate guanylyltransferase [Marinifilaceae bacterium]
MSKIIYVSGGQKSGKTTQAERIALSLSERPIYLATSRIWDEEHRKRIQHHQANRGDEWITIEEEKYLSKHDFKDKVVLIDCITLWMTNFFFDNKQDIEKSLLEAKKEISELFKQEATFIIVSNEIGMGGSPSDSMAFKFTDMLGLMNQFIAKQSDEAYLTVSGIPVKIK